MNFSLVKLGKVWAIIKHEGIVRGGKRILFSACSLFRSVGSGDVLFVASGVGDSARYRCHHMAEMLRFNGFKISVTTQDNPFLVRYADKFSVCIFHRTSWTLVIKKFFHALKEKKKTVLFDTDDLVFDGELFKRTAAYEAMNALEKKQYEHGVGSEFLEDPFVAAITTSTNFLAERLKKFGKPVFVVPNRLSEEDIKIAEAILEVRIRNKELGNVPKKADVVIGYFSGSTGHDRDFATVASVLTRLLDARPNLRLFLAGPLSLPLELEAFSDRISRVTYAPRAEHLKNLASVDVNIAPLEIGDPFCEAKSELKFFEAGIVGVPTVAAATGTFCEAITDGIDGYVAKDENEWREKLERLISDAMFRKSMGGKARETTLKKYTTKNAKDDEYAHFLKTKIPHS